MTKVYVTKYSVLKGIVVYEVDEVKTNSDSCYIRFSLEGYRHLYSDTDATTDYSLAQKRYKEKVEKELKKAQRKVKQLEQILEDL